MNQRLVSQMAGPDPSQQRQMAGQQGQMAGLQVQMVDSMSQWWTNKPRWTVSKASATLWSAFKKAKPGFQAKARCRWDRLKWQDLIRSGRLVLTARKKLSLQLEKAMAVLFYASQVFFSVAFVDVILKMFCILAPSATTSSESTRNPSDMKNSVCQK